MLATCVIILSMMLVYAVFVQMLLDAMSVFIRLMTQILLNNAVDALTKGQLYLKGNVNVLIMRVSIDKETVRNVYKVAKYVREANAYNVLNKSRVM